MRQVQRSRALVSFAIVLGLSASVCSAQTPPARAGALGSGGAVTNPLRLGTMLPTTPVTVLMSPAVQKELKLTDAQKNKVYQLSNESGQKQRDLGQAAQVKFLSGAPVNPQELMAARDHLRGEIEQAIAGILDKKQRERMSQIVLQLEGPLAVSRPEIADQLNLNPRQRQAIQGTMLQLQIAQRRLNMEARRQAVMLAQLDPSQFGQVREQMAKLREMAVQQISKVVDKKQKANFAKMLGEPFDLAKIDAPDTATSTSQPDTKSAPETTSTTKADSDSQNAESAPPEKEAPKANTKPGRRKSRTKSSSNS